MSGGFGKSKQATIKRGSHSAKLPKSEHWEISGDKLVGLGVSVSSLRRREKKPTPKCLQNGALKKKQSKGVKTTWID